MENSEIMYLEILCTPTEYTVLLVRKNERLYSLGDTLRNNPHLLVCCFTGLCKTWSPLIQSC